MTTRVNPATPADAERVEKFLVSVPEFHGTVHEHEESKIWNWLFVRNGSVENVWYAEDETARVVAHYGMAPMEYKVRDRSVKAGMICKLAVSEAYRKSPIFMSMTLKLLGEYPKRGFAFATGLANRSGLLEFHLAFGFKKIGEVPIYAKPVRIGGMARKLLPSAVAVLLSPLTGLADLLWSAWLKSGGRSNPEIQIESISSFGQDFDQIEDLMSRRHPLHPLRNSRTLNWRYFSTPWRNYRVFKVSRRGKLEGYFVLRKMPMKQFQALGIVDLFFDPADRALGRSVMKKIDRVALDEGVDLAAMLVSGEATEKLLQRSLYLATPEKFALVIHEKSKALGLTESLLSDWYVTWFDHDFV